MAQEIKYNPNTGRQEGFETTTADEHAANSAALAVNERSTQSLAARAGEGKVAPSDPDEPKSPGPGASLGDIAKFAEAKRRYAEKKRTQAATPSR